MTVLNVLLIVLFAGMAGAAFGLLAVALFGARRR